MVTGSEIRMIEKLETKILRNKNQQCLYLINKLGAVMVMIIW
jgi:hypothetical protein